MSDDIDIDTLVFMALADDAARYEQQEFDFGDEVNWIVEGF